MSDTTIKRRTETVPIFQGDDAAAIAEALADFNRATAAEALGRSGSRRLTDDSPVQAAADHYDAVVAEAEPRAIRATVQALGRKAYRRLLAENPPREDHEDDANLGYNPVGLHDAILEFFDLETGEKTVMVPEFASKNALVDWLDDLNDGNFTQLAAAAVRVNEGGSPSPKASLGSQVERMFAATSQSPVSTD